MTMLRTWFQTALIAATVSFGFDLGAMRLWAQEDAAEAATEPAQDAKAQDGKADLDEAVQLKINATDTRDLDRIVALCESAMEKGLDEGNKAQAKELMASTLKQHSEQLQKLIFSPQPDRRWRVFRRDALTKLEKYVELKPDDGAAYLAIARLNRLDGGNLADARAAIEKAIELAGDDQKKLSIALVTRAALSESPEDQMSDLGQAIKIDPANVEAIRDRAILNSQAGNMDQAIDDMKRWIDLEPENPAPVILTLQLLESQDRSDEVLEILNKGIENMPESEDLLAMRSELQMQNSEYDSAMADAESVLDMNPDNRTALIVRAIVQAEREKLEDAMRDIDRVINLDPRNARAIWIRSSINARMKNYDAAIRDMNSLSRILPDESLYMPEIANLQFMAGRADEGSKIYEDLLKKDPENWKYYRGRGDANLSVGNHKEAIADLEKALELMPADDADDGVYNNLAWVLSTSTFDDLRDGKRAVELATKAAELSQFDAPHILSTLASSYAEAKDFEKAREWAEKAVKLAEEKHQSDKTIAGLRRELEAYQENRAWRELQEAGKDDTGFPAPKEEEGGGS